MKSITDQEIQEAAQRCKTGHLHAMGSETARLPAIQKMAAAAMVIGILVNPADALELAIASAMIMGIEIGERRALESMTAPNSTPDLDTRS